MDDLISRQAAIDAVRDRMGKGETNIGDTFIECFEMILNALPSAQPEPQWIPIFKAKDEDSDQWVTGFYFAYPETTYCFTEDYERHPVKIIHCITFHRMTDWSLPNRPTVCNIDIDTLELVGWVDSKRKTFGNEPWIVPEPWRGEETCTKMTSN